MDCWSYGLWASTSHLNRQQLPSSKTQLSFWCLRSEEPPRISAYTLYFQKLHVESLAYILAAAADSMGLSSFKFVQCAPKYAYFPRQSAFCWFKVIQRHPLVPYCDYGPTLHRFRDTATYWLKIAYFSHPSLIRRPMFPLEFRAEVNQQLETSYGAILQWRPPWF